MRKDNKDNAFGKLSFFSIFSTCFFNLCFVGFFFPTCPFVSTLVLFIIYISMPFYLLFALAYFLICWCSNLSLASWHSLFMCHYIIICFFACHCFLLVLQVFSSLENSSFMLHLTETFMSYNVLPFCYISLK